MARVKRGVPAHAKHKKILKKAKGYYGRRKNTIRVAKQAVEKAMQYAYRDRKRRKRTFRALWIQRDHLRPIYQRPCACRHCRGPQGVGRPRRQRRGGLQGPRRPGCRAREEGSLVPSRGCPWGRPSGVPAVSLGGAMDREASLPA